MGRAAVYRSYHGAHPRAAPTRRLRPRESVRALRAARDGTRASRAQVGRDAARLDARLLRGVTSFAPPSRAAALIGRRHAASDASDRLQCSPHGACDEGAAVSNDRGACLLVHPRCAGDQPCQSRPLAPIPAQSTPRFVITSDGSQIARVGSGSGGSGSGSGSTRVRVGSG